MAAPENPSLPSFRRAFLFWLKLGFISFGGPAGQIAIMHRELVERKGWMDERHFMNGLNFCMLLPGPEAQQLATYLGWRLHGARGGVAAGSLFVLPSAFVLFALSWLYVAGGELAWVAAIFHGLLGAVIAVVLDAVIRIGKKALRSTCLLMLPIASFVGIYFFNVHFVLIVLLAGLVGLVGHRFVPGQFPPVGAKPVGGGVEPPRVLQLPPVPGATWKRSVAVLAIVMVLWWTPVFGAAALLGWESTTCQLGLFFSKVALVTFGGAYAVLPFVAQQAVEHHHWLDHTQMMSGLALAESTPGPLIMVLQFVGFLAGWHQPDGFNPLFAAALGSAMTTWVTFLPCFLFVFLGAPWIERLSDFPNAGAALSAITACVVGVILNLAVKFATAAIWPTGGGPDYFVAGVAVLGFFALSRLNVPLLPVLAGSAVAGLCYRFFVQAS